METLEPLAKPVKKIRGRGWEKHPVLPTYRSVRDTFQNLWRRAKCEHFARLQTKTNKTVVGATLAINSALLSSGFSLPFIEFLKSGSGAFRQLWLAVRVLLSAARWAAPLLPFHR
jgi:hypothetical protein